MNHSRLIEVYLDSDIGELAATFVYEDELMELDKVLCGCVDITHVISNQDTLETLKDLAFDELYG